MPAVFALLFAALAAAGVARASALGPLVEPSALAAALAAAEPPLVLDVRPPEAHAAGHVPGAVGAPYGSWRGPQENPGQPMTHAALTERLRSAGVTFERPVVVVHAGTDDTDFGSAARVYWTLKSAGHERLSILNGGMAAWVAEGLPTTAEPTVVARSEIEPLALTDWTATREEVAAAERGETGAVLVDARPDAFFRGLRKHDAAAEPGTLFGAVSLVHAMWFAPDRPVVAPDEGALARARALLDEAGDAPVVSFCNTGHWAATNWFVLSELVGAPGVKLYPESVVGWSRAGLPLSPGG